MWKDVFELIKYINIEEIALRLASTIFVIGVFWTLINLVRVMYYEFKIKDLNRRKELEVLNKKEQMKGRLSSILDGEVRAIKDKYEPKIERYERERKFILDRLPFIKN